ERSPGANDEGVDARGDRERGGYREGGDGGQAEVVEGHCGSSFRASRPLKVRRDSLTKSGTSTSHSLGVIWRGSGPHHFSHHSTVRPCAVTCSSGGRLWMHAAWCLWLPGMGAVAIMAFLMASRSSSLLLMWCSWWR